MTDITESRRVFNQSHEEWLNENDNKISTDSSKFIHDKIEPLPNSNTLFRYHEHRTTCRGSVVLVFHSLDHKLEVIKFFNVSLKGRNKNYPAGRLGQFNPPPSGKFRRFWMLSVGKAPTRWSRVHKSMRSSLKELIFTGTIQDAIDSKGNSYLKFSEVSLCE